jgi:fructose-1,6-bisphosphatase/inositol monophosphatase family enzyme
MPKAADQQDTSAEDVSAIVDRMLRFAEDSGALALAKRERGLRITHKGGDLGQTLTETDLEISALLHKRFGPRVIEEETAEDLGRERAATLLAEADWTFIADPIDGTKPYAGGLSGWGTMIAACRDGQPAASVCILPAWVEARDKLPIPVVAADQRGLLLAAWDGAAYWAPTRGGRRSQPLKTLVRSTRPTFHVGWLSVAAQLFNLDRTHGFYPWCESSSVADLALLATGRLDASTACGKIWDVAPGLPIMRALGFDLYRWSDLAPGPAALIDVFDAELFAGDPLWLICRDMPQAEALRRAIRRSNPSHS